MVPNLNSLSARRSPRFQLPLPSSPSRPSPPAPPQTASSTSTGYVQQAPVQLSHRPRCCPCHKRLRITVSFTCCAQSPTTPMDRRSRSPILSIAASIPHRRPRSTLPSSLPPPISRNHSPSMYRHAALSLPQSLPPSAQAVVEPPLPAKILQHIQHRRH